MQHTVLMPASQIVQMCELLYGQDAVHVDWRKFLVCVAQPWPLPSSQQLVEAVHTFSVLGSGERVVGREEYKEARTWLTEQSQPSPKGFDRNKELKNVSLMERKA